MCCRWSQKVAPDDPILLGGNEVQKQAQQLFDQFSSVVSPVRVANDTAKVNTGRATRSHGAARFQRVSSLRTLGDPVPDEHGHRNPKFLWTPSSVGLEGAIQEEKQQESEESDLLSQELRLQQRLSRLNLEIDVMDGDGNCLFRSASMGLYGSASHHPVVRRNSVQHMREHKSEFEPFLETGLSSYLSDMGRSGTWGDELTLRAICNHYGVVINCLTSNQQNWFLRYEPDELKVALEIFLTYIAPVHYNAIRKRTFLRRSMLQRSNSRIQQALDRAGTATPTSGQQQDGAVPETIQEE
ncbi:hypothetical protein WJX84_011966 [Apatococcus fuscideae]|uniref:OTU domain-containing protein n=1 Tax=Apatococcus fuscideae TaxID=2026836 RepID=A0AAW1RR07_9CHLO